MTVIVPAKPNPTTPKAGAAGTLSAENIAFLVRASAEAAKGGCIFPDYAACEAALESAHGGVFGASTLAAQDNNLFGMKQHVHPVYGTCSLPTEEFLGGQWKRVNAEWVKYPDWATCFADRMSTLRRLAPHYPHYAAALAATDGSTYVREVSKTWSTDENRGQKVLDIYRRWKQV